MNSSQTSASSTSEQEEKRRRMTEEPVEGLIGRLAVPTMVSMLITTFYNMADTYFVGRINESAQGAVGVVFSLMAIIQAFGFFFGHGSGNYISRELGRGNRAESEKMAATGFFSAFFTGILIMIFGLIFLRPFAVFLGATDTILPYAMSYMRVILIGAPYMCAALVLNNQLRFQGNAFYAMLGLTAGGVLNLGLDPLFMFVFDMGITGAAVATAVSQFLSFLLLWFGMRRSDNLKIHWRNFTPSGHYYLQILNGGSPSLCRQGISGIATTCLNNVAKAYGDPAIAALSVVAKLMNFAASTLIGFGQGFQPVCGFNYGAGRIDRVKKAYKFCVLTSSAVLLLLAAGCYFAAEPIVTAFAAKNEETVQLAVRAFRYQLLVFPLIGFYTISNMMMQTIGRAVSASLLAMSRQGLLYLPMLYLLSSLFRLDGLLFTQTAADLLSFLLAIPLTIYVWRTLERKSPMKSQIKHKKV